MSISLRDGACGRVVGWSPGMQKMLVAIRWLLSPASPVTPKSQVGVLCFPESSDLGSHSAHTILQGLQLSQHFLGQILIDLFHQVAPDITHLLFPEVLWE